MNTIIIYACTSILVHWTVQTALHRSVLLTHSICNFGFTTGIVLCYLFNNEENFALSALNAFWVRNSDQENFYPLGKDPRVWTFVNFRNYQNIGFSLSFVRIIWTGCSDGRIDESKIPRVSRAKFEFEDRNFHFFGLIQWKMPIMAYVIIRWMFIGSESAFNIMVYWNASLPWEFNVLQDIKLPFVHQQSNGLIKEII